jgi:hypothetical protein
VRQWKFHPGRKNSQTVSTHLQVPVMFTLSDPATAPASPALAEPASK